MVLRPLRYGMLRGRDGAEKDFYGFSAQIQRMERAQSLPADLGLVEGKGASVVMREARGGSDEHVEMLPL